MTDYSLNETASRAKLAAKGAGYSWGMAEEVSRAVSWLVSRQLPGPAMLLKLLSVYPNAKSIRLAVPKVSGDCFTCNEMGLCPIASGCALSDMYSEIGNDASVSFTDVHCPILLLPFIVDMAERSKKILVAVCDDNSMTTDGKHVHFSRPDVVTLKKAKTVIFRVAKSSEIAFNENEFINYGNRVEVNNEDWEGLGVFAQQTYAPSTESSRALGAGAGLNDND